MKTNTFNNPVVYFNIWWGFWAGISTLGLLGLNVPSSQVYILVMTLMGSFSLGCLFVIKKKHFNDLGILNNTLLNSTKRKINIIYLAQIFVLIILIYHLAKAIPLITSMPTSTYRLEVSSTQLLYGSNIVDLIFSHIITPIMWVGLLISICGYLLGHKNKKLLLLSIINAMIFSVMTLGRWYILRILMFFFLAYFLLKLFNKNSQKNINLSKRNKKVIYLVIPFGLAGAITMSSFRSSESTSVLYTMYEYVIRYFSGSFIALDNYLAHFAETLPFQYGRATVGGIDEFFVVIFRFFDSSIVNITNKISPFANEFIDIGGGHRYNAFYSAIYNFHIDGGIIAVILFPFVLGLIIGGAYNSFIKKPNIFNLSLLVFLLHLSLLATLRWEFQYLRTWLVLLLLFWLIATFKRKDNTKKLREFS